MVDISKELVEDGRKIFSIPSWIPRSYGKGDPFVELYEKEEVS